MKIDHIGVMGGRKIPLNPNKYKSYALFFDSIRLQAPITQFVKEKSFVADFEFLKEKGVITVASKEEINLSEQERSDFFKNNRELFDEQFARYIVQLGTNVGTALFNAYVTAQTGVSPGFESRSLYKVVEENAALSQPEFPPRLLAALLRFKGSDAVYLGDKDSFDKAIDRKTSQRDLYEIIIDDIQIPDESVPWDELLSFRSDEGSRHRLRALRLWVNEVAKDKLTLGEAVEKVKYLKDEYRLHMKGAGIKTGSGFLKALLLGGAAIFEAIKLNFKDAIEIGFNVFDSRGELFEAERDAPGRELAYLVRASETLHAFK